MPYQGYEDGLYLVKQVSAAKGMVDHYGIVDIGNRLGIMQAVGVPQPVVIHQTPPAIRFDWLQSTGKWDILGRISNEPDAIQRMRHAMTDPSYDLFGNNCEHFARYVASGVKESQQLQVGAVLVGLAAIVFLRD